MTFKRILAAAAASSMLLALVACAGEPSAEPTDEGANDVVRVAVAQRPLSSALMLFAIAEDTFANHGIDVEYTEVNGASVGVAALLSGDIDVGYFGAAAALAANAEGSDLVLVGGGVGPSQLVIVRSDIAEGLDASPSDSPRERIAALRGLTIATATAGSSVETLTKALLLFGGLDASAGDVTLVNMSDPVAIQQGLVQGQFDAAIHGSGSGLERPMLEGTAVEWLVQTEEDLPEIDNLIISSVATRAWVDADPDLAERFALAIKEADDIFRSDPDHVRDVLRATYYESQEQEEFELSFVNASASWNAGGVIPKAQFDNAVRALETTIDRELGMDYEDIVAVDAARE